MTKNMFLDEIKKFTEEATEDFILPVRMQKGDTEQAYRKVNVYKMRIPNASATTKYIPYIIQQIITGKDIQAEGKLLESTIKLRTIFCVYNEDEQEGALTLIELMERLRIALLKQIVIGDRFVLDTAEGIEQLAYPDDTSPYFAGEMVTTWQMPPVQREIRKIIN